MKSLFRRSYLVLGLVVALASLMPAAASTTAYAGPAYPNPGSDDAVTASASLHNPNFDNHIWYDFNERYPYGGLTPHSWMPDDDTGGGPQDWRIWYMDGTIPILTWASQNQEATSTDRAIKSRTYWGGRYQAGVYQVIPNATPCLTYQFQMYGYFRPGSNLRTLRVGIDRNGYYPTDVAVHGFPSTIEWGDSHTEYTSGYGQLSATAEAWGDTITVFTYADADSGEVLWDTGSFQEATPDLISDPDNPPAGTIAPGVSVGSTSATISWSTASATGQVYYRFVSNNTTPISSTTSFTHTIYLPLVNNNFPPPWLHTALDKIPSTSHSVTITGLQANSTYEYIVASRGLSGGQCETWVSSKKEFTTAP